MGLREIPAAEITQTIKRHRIDSKRKEKTIFKAKYFLGSMGICLLALYLMVAVGLAQEKVIKIGVPLALTGPKGKYGEMHHKSYLIALEEINSGGGLRRGRYKGYELEFLFEDTEGKPEKGKTLTEKLIYEEKAPFIVGGYASSVVFNIAKVCEQNKIPFISPSGAADTISQRRGKYIFRLNPPASEYASGLQDFFGKVVLPRSMVILFENTPFGISTGKAMKTWCEEKGVEVLMYEPYEAWAVDFRPMLKEVKAKDPDVIYMVSYLTDAVLLMKQSRELNIQPRLFAGGAAGFTRPQFVKRAGDASENIVSATLWVPNINYPGVKNYVGKHKRRYGTVPDYHGAEAYSAASVLRDVLERAKSLESKDIVQALAATDTMTVFGPVKFISYKNFTNQNRLITPVIQIQNGKHVTIWPPEAATATYVYPVHEWFKR
jgi:branched-chain amino acid transport system substrate-binding protein